MFITPLNLGIIENAFALRFNKFILNVSHTIKRHENLTWAIALDRTISGFVMMKQLFLCTALLNDNPNAKEMYIGTCPPLLPATPPRCVACHGGLQNPTCFFFSIYLFIYFKATLLDCQILLRQWYIQFLVLHA